MTQDNSGKEILNVTLARRLSVDSNGETKETNETFIQVFWAAVEGLYRHVTGNELKVLMILAHHARVLGDPSRSGAKREFKDLVKQGLVRPEDRGRLCAIVSEVRIARLAGAARTTVRRAGESLQEKGYIRIVPLPKEGRLESGRFGANKIYIFGAFKATHIKKFSSAELEVETEKAPVEEPSGNDQPCSKTLHGEDQPCSKTLHGEGQPCSTMLHGEAHRVAPCYTNKNTLQYLIVPLRVPYGAGDARTHLPLLDELSLDFTWEEQAEYVEFWLQRFVNGKKIPAANTALAKAFGRAFGFQRDGALVVEPGQGEYARLGGMAKEFQDLGGHVAVWRAACRMWGRELQGDPLAYLAQSLIRERDERQEARCEHGKQKQRGGASSRSGARRPPGSVYRRLPDGAERDYLADPCVEGNRGETESG